MFTRLLFSHLGSLYLQPRKMFTSNKQGFISAGATHLASIINKITNVPVSIIVTSLKIVVLTLLQLASSPH